MTAGKEIFGHAFKDESLLREALTTPACRMDEPAVRDNQRLEFLGDAVLGLLSAERVFDAFPGEQEGPLTVRRTHMVSSAALCEAAGRLGLAERLRRNRHAAALSPNSKTLADAVEAVIGAAYLDGGLDAARRVFSALGLTANAALPEWSANPKGELQVRAQAMKPPRHPEYVLLKTEGMAHEPRFSVRVTVEGMGSAEAVARTLKEAESLAASRLLLASAPPRS
ncbi:MAG: ribonuclease III [Kiritimatiellae bacterium]|nr:ribonuclease III [Kiritimatiellia bacterium]